jgi:hypothetical protein
MTKLRILAPLLAATATLAALTLAAPLARAQGSQRLSAVQGETGAAVAGADVWVCSGIVTPTFTGTPPCTPLATIYADPMQAMPITQPVISDGLGNFTYFASAGTYTEVINGDVVKGYSTIIVLPCAPSSPTSGCGGSAGNPAMPNGSIQYNNVGAFGASILSEDSGATTITDSGNLTVAGAHLAVNTTSNGGFNLNVNGTGNFVGLLSAPGGISANAETAGSSFSFPTKLFFMAAGCNNSTAGNAWQIGASNAPIPACQGMHSAKGVLQFARGNVAYIEAELPSDWNSSANVDLKVAFTTADTTTGHFTAWNVQTGCNSLAGSATDDPTLNAAQTVSSTIGSSAVAGGEYLAVLTAVTTTGCSPGNNFIVAITRNSSGADTNTDAAVAAKWIEVTFSRTITAANR